MHSNILNTSWIGRFAADPGPPIPLPSRLTPPLSPSPSPYKEKNTPGEYQSIESRKPMISLFKSRTLCGPRLPGTLCGPRLPGPALAPPPQCEGAGLRVSARWADTPIPKVPGVLFATGLCQVFFFFIMCMSRLSSLSSLYVRGFLFIVYKMSKKNNVQLTIVAKKMYLFPSNVWYHRGGGVRPSVIKCEKGGFISKKDVISYLNAP